jgi:hypothetical protein
MRRFPDAHTGSDFAALYPSAEFFGEEHAVCLVANTQCERPVQIAPHSRNQFRCSLLFGQSFRIKASKDMALPHP